MDRSFKFEDSLFKFFEVNKSAFEGGESMHNMNFNYDHLTHFKCYQARSSDFY